MNAEIPAQAVIGIATVVAALITGTIALVNLTLSKEQKVSEFRQAWIDGLRDDLSRFASSVRFASHAAHVAAIYSPQVHSQIFPHTPEQIAQLRVTASEALSRIRLRLNSEEPEHNELLRLLESANARSLAIGATSPNASDALTALDAAVEYARPILKAEWKRVKRGEPGFTYLRIWLVPVILLLSMIFAAVIAFGRFHY